MSAGAIEAEAEPMGIIDAYLEHLHRLGRSPYTINHRRKLIRRLDRELPFGISEVSVEDLREWLYGGHLAQNSRASYYGGIRSFFTWATDPADPWLDLDPSRNLEPTYAAEGVPRPVTDHQLQTILLRAEEPYHTWATIAAYQGLRCIEISRLNREDVNEVRMYIFGKGGRPRTHDTDPYVWAAVRDLPPGPIARHVDGTGRATPLQVSRRARVHFLCDLKVDVTMHQLRHWLGVAVQREYGDIRVTQEILGHKHLSSTQIYTMGTEEQQRKARASIPRLAG